MAHSSSHLLKTVFGCALLQEDQVGGTEEGNNVDLSHSRGNRNARKMRLRDTKAVTK